MKKLLLIKKIISDVKVKYPQANFVGLLLHVAQYLMRLHRNKRDLVRNEKIIDGLKNKYGVSTVVKDIFDFKMILDLDDKGISRELFFTGVHEGNSTRLIRDFIKPGMKIIEIGANIGYYTLIEASLIGKTGKIFAFEPSEYNMGCLKNNVYINNYNDIVEFFPYGVGAEDGELTFYQSDKCNTSSFIERNDDQLSSVSSSNVQVVSLDNYFKNNESFDFFRMDVEGYEVEVIKGMSKILSSENKPKGCFIEVHSGLLNVAGTSAKEFIERLTGYGYKVDTAYYRGSKDICVKSTGELLSHHLLEKSYWEVFFVENGK